MPLEEPPDLRREADGLDGVFRPEMPAALEGKISREQWDPAIRKAAAAEAEVRGSRRRQ